MDYKQDGFHFTKVPFQNRNALYVQSNKIVETVEYIRNHGVDHIILNRERGYRSKSLDFLSEVADRITGIDIEIEVRDASPLNLLSGLEYLSLAGVNSQQVIDFLNFPSLAECNVVWSENLINMDSCKSLRDLTIWNYNRADLLPLKEIDSLECLSLYDCAALSDLGGMEFLANIRDIVLYKCRNLTSIAQIASASDTLVSLNIIKAAKLHDYSPIGRLERLENLTITDSGASADAGFLEALKSLHYGNINIDIMDGNVGNLLSLPVKFKNYDHFSHKNIHRLKMNSEGKYVLVGPNVGK